MRTIKSKRRKYNKKGGNLEEYESVGHLNIPRFLNLHVYLNNNYYNNNKKLMCAKQLLENIENKNIYTYVLLIHVRTDVDDNNNITGYYFSTTVYPKLMSREPSLESISETAISPYFGSSKLLQISSSIERFFHKLVDQVPIPQSPQTQIALGGRYNY